MFELGLRDYGSSWTRLQEALRAQQQLQRHEQPPQEASAGGEASRGKSKAGLIGLITRRRDGRKKDKRTKHKAPDEAKEPSSEEDAKPEPTKSSSSTATAQKSASEQKSSSDDKSGCGVGAHEKGREMRTRDHFEPENGLSREAFLSELAAGSQWSDSRVNRRQASPSDKESRRFAEDRSEVANGGLEPGPLPLALDKAPRGRKMVAGSKDDDIYRRHRQRSFKGQLLSDVSAGTVDHNGPPPVQRQGEQVYRERSFVQPRSSNEARRDPEEMLRGRSLTRPSESDLQRSPKERARRGLSPSGPEDGDARRRRALSAHRADNAARRHADAAQASPVEHAWDLEASNCEPNAHGRTEKSRPRDEGGDECPRDGGRRAAGSDSVCTRCGDRVYPKELVMPKPGVLLHSGCFKCRECGVKLTLHTFFTNQRDTRDADVYCRTHVPRLGPATVDGNALSILTSRNSREIKFTRYPHRAEDAEPELPSCSQDE